MNYLINSILIFCTLWLSGCATMTPSKLPAEDKNIPWDTRVKTLTALKQWDIQGVLGVRTAQDAWSASLNWQQSGENYRIMLFGPLGTHSYELTGTPASVTLVTAEGKRFEAASPEKLLAEQLGWQLPVSNLNFWVRGLPVPNAAMKMELDAFHRLSILRQQGWTVRFLQYTSHNGVDVPSKIFLDSEGLNVKIVIKHWR